MTKKKVKIHVKESGADSRREPAGEDQTAAVVDEQEPEAEAAPEEGQLEEPEAASSRAPDVDGSADLREEVELWRDRALRLQAEMENFRKRQRRIADDQVQAERERLLRAFLKIADDIERALGAADADPGALRQGVEIINRALTQVLEQQSVRRLEAKGEVFDPNLHEAISILDSGEDHPEPIVLEVIEAGYEMGDRLLRPAKVVVAK